jgi:hypothetical protein
MLQYYVRHWPGLFRPPNFYPTLSNFLNIFLLEENCIVFLLVTIEKTRPFDFLPQKFVIACTAIK